MENQSILEMKNKIEAKLGFNLGSDTFNVSPDEPHEKDGVPNPYDKLTLEELLFIRDNNYFQKLKQEAPTSNTKY